MPFPAWLGRVNRIITNRVTGSFAQRLPGFAILLHTGRRSGRSYQTPVNLFRSKDGYVIALTYGRNTDWVRNVMIAGGCTVRTRAIAMRLERPRIVTDRGAMLVPAPIRPLLRLTRVSEFMKLRPTVTS